MGMIQIRNVPDDVHRSLKARAASLGLSLSDYLNRELAALAALPTFTEVAGYIHLAERVDVDAAALVRDLRGPLPGDG